MTPRSTSERSKRATPRDARRHAACIQATFARRVRPWKAEGVVVLLAQKDATVEGGASITASGAQGGKRHDSVRRHDARFGTHRRDGQRGSGRDGADPGQARGRHRRRQRRCLGRDRRRHDPRRRRFSGQEPRHPERVGRRIVGSGDDAASRCDRGRRRRQSHRVGGRHYALLREHQRARRRAVRKRRLRRSLRQEAISVSTASSTRARRTERRARCCSIRRRSTSFRTTTPWSRTPRSAQGAFFRRAPTFRRPKSRSQRCVPT